MSGNNPAKLELETFKRYFTETVKEKPFQ